MSVETIQWVSADGDLPEPFHLVLVASQDEIDQSKISVSPGFRDELCVWLESDFGKLRNVTHWAEMPKGPVQ